MTTTMTANSPTVTNRPLLPEMQPDFATMAVPSTADWDFVRETVSMTNFVRETYRGVVFSAKKVEDALEQLRSRGEVYAAVMTVDVDESRPVSSDYDPTVFGRVYLRVAYRNNATPNNPVDVTAIPLASMYTQFYPTASDRERLRATVTEMVETVSPLTDYWKSLLTTAKSMVASPDRVEAARTELILGMMEQIRNDMRAALNDKMRRGCNIGVKVVRGRKVPVGTMGKVFWAGKNQWGLRVGLKTDKGTVYWTSVANVEVTDQPNEMEVLATARQRYTNIYSDLFGSARD
jgi:hypothetical protein